MEMVVIVQGLLFLKFLNLSVFPSMMRENANITIVGEHVILVPYEPKHVEKYHAWMQSKELQELTASEPLSIEQEYKMQSSWRNDQDKCTFIVLHSAPLLTCQDENRPTFEATGDEIAAMVGDVNLFLNDSESKFVAETEIMIAEQWARRKGCGCEALLIMLDYAMKHLEIKKFVAKIGETNLPSLALFNRLGFVEISRSHVFQEITLEVSSNQLSLYALERLQTVKPKSTPYKAS
eukprot:gene10566-2690_t